MTFAIKDVIANVDVNLLGAQSKGVYDRLSAQINEQYIAAVYQQAEQDYNATNFPEAITGLEKVVQTEEDYEDGYAIYYLAQSYRQVGDVENAKKYYQRMVELHPGTKIKNQAAYRIILYQLIRLLFQNLCLMMIQFPWHTQDQASIFSLISVFHNATSFLKISLQCIIALFPCIICQ